jgi:hypothetical protein
MVVFITLTISTNIHPVLVFSFSPADEHNDVQKKTFTKWINARFSKVSKMLVDFTVWSVPPSDFSIAKKDDQFL